MKATFAIFAVLLFTVAYCGSHTDGDDYYWLPDKQSDVKPVVVFHGIDDDCHGGLQTGLVDQLGQELSTYVRCVEYAKDIKTWTVNILEQSKNACELVKGFSEFNNGYSVVGISAGSIISRYMVEACDSQGQIEHFVTLGGPHMGVTQIPDCHTGIICSIGNYLVDKLAYTSLLQKLLGPAGYYRDVAEYQKYLDHSILLADLNNERATKNQTYKERVIALKKMTLIMFLKDEIVYPKESEWFGTFAADNKTIIPLEKTDFYTQDWLGIRTLEEAGKLFKFSINNRHVHWSSEEIHTMVVPGLKDN
mmetsp:Transcript_49098/g.56441  ORF Transcript_49098/g.56441 Transcript_49098/m.56441 type:complete len:306 (+) Transcript_49098:29-946(+)